MYIAREQKHKQPHYYLRQSYTKDGTALHRDIVDLGRDPSMHIVYPGGNAFYVAEDIEDAVVAAGIQVDPDHLEDLFWPYVRPDIQHAVYTFRHRSKNNSRRRKLTESEEDDIRIKVHPFDKRRQHFLRFGDMDQGPVERMPPGLFKKFPERSRDEIEQRFLKAEQALRPSELKTYVYTSFDLKRFFNSILAAKMPQGLDQAQVDEYFIEEICRLNRSLFDNHTQTGETGLNEYLIRYVIMFFDYPYENSKLLDDYVNDFMYHHHFYRRPPSPSPGMKIEKAEQVFEIPKGGLKTITKTILLKRYRRMAQERHPDKAGGSNEKFVELNRAYERLLSRIEGGSREKK